LRNGSFFLIKLKRCPECGKDRVLPYAHLEGENIENYWIGERCLECGWSAIDAEASAQLREAYYNLEKELSRLKVLARAKVAVNGV